MSRQPIGLHAPTHLLDGQDPLLGYQNRAYYFASTHVNAGATTLMTWTKSALADPLDLTAPTIPLFVSAGIYCVSIFCNANDGGVGPSLPAGKSFDARLEIDAGGIGGFQGEAYGIWTQPASGTFEQAGALSLTWYAPQQAECVVLLTNRDSAGHDFDLNAFVQQIV